MTTVDSAIQSPQSLLGEIHTHATRINYRVAPPKTDDVVFLERERTHLRDPHAIRIQNAHETVLGYLPRSVACWLAPLLDAKKVRIEGYLPARRGVLCAAKARILPVVVSVFVAGQAEDFFRRDEIRNKEDVLHHVLYQAYQQARLFSDPHLIELLAESMRPLTRQKMHPETRLLLALLPAIAKIKQEPPGKVCL
ncbi:MAG: HIRAN domain-containing protein [Pirellulales bacterium]|nr:HIRAN domain-containing protein [Pirellulales bacterium]